MHSLLLSRRDLEFMLYEWLDVAALSSAPRYADHSRETFDAVLDTCERMATELFAPHNQKADQHEPHFDGQAVRLIDEVKPALQAFADAGLLAASQDYELGGMQLPTVVEKAALTYIYAANIGTSAYPVVDHGQCEPVAGAWQCGADRRVREAGAGRPLLRHHVPVRAAGRLFAFRHHNACGT